MKQLLFTVIIVLSSSFSNASTYSPVYSQWIDEDSSGFGTDTYEEDGCFC